MLDNPIDFITFLLFFPPLMDLWKILWIMRWWASGYSQIKAPRLTQRCHKQQLVAIDIYHAAVLYGGKRTVKQQYSRNKYQSAVFYGLGSRSGVKAAPFSNKKCHLITSDFPFFFIHQVTKLVCLFMCDYIKIYCIKSFHSKSTQQTQQKLISHHLGARLRLW